MSRACPIGGKSRLLWKTEESVIPTTITRDLKVVGITKNHKKSIGGKCGLWGILKLLLERVP